MAARRPAVSQEQELPWGRTLQRQSAQVGQLLVQRVQLMIIKRLRALLTTQPDRPAGPHLKLGQGMPFDSHLSQAVDVPLKRSYVPERLQQITR